PALAREALVELAVAGEPRDQEISDRVAAVARDHELAFLQADRPGPRRRAEVVDALALPGEAPVEPPVRAPGHEERSCRAAGVPGARSDDALAADHHVLQTRPARDLDPLAPVARERLVELAVRPQLDHRRPLVHGERVRRRAA